MSQEVKNPLRAQSKYCLLGSSAKTGKFFIRGSQERKRCTFLGPKHKSTNWDRTPPTYTSNLIYMCAGGFRGHNSLNRIELSQFVQELLFFCFGFPQLWGVGQVDGGCLGWSAIVYMSSGMFRGKESSNRIELSGLFQDLLNFGVLGSLWLWGWGWVDWGGGWLGVPPHMCTCMCMHAHTRMHMHTW